MGRKKRTFVRIEWDRGHETVDALLVARLDDGPVVHEIHDHEMRRGFTWIRDDEILAVDSVDDDEPMVRLAAIRRTKPVDPGFTSASLRDILLHARTNRLPVAYYMRRTGSGELLVGVPSSVGKRSVVFRLWDTGGRDDGTDRRRIDDLIAVEWATPYLDALSELRAAEEPSS